MTIKISLVGTSFLNKKHEIRKCINSVLAQNYKNYEFIIILEKEDKNLFLFKEFEKKNKKIKVFLNKQEPGLASCLNQGVKKSKGEFIGRIDFDDLYFSDKLQKQIYYLKKNKHVDICGTNAWFFEKKEIYKKKICINHNAIKKNFFFYNSIIHPSVLLKKKNFI